MLSRPVTLIIYIVIHIRKKITDTDTMLRKFSVKGYKGFKEELTLDFTAVKGYHFNDDCITDDGVLGKAILIGANGSGKTNLGYALFDIVYTLTDNQTDMHQMDANSFMNGDISGGSASFRYEFQDGAKIITYEYKKKGPMELTFERFEIDGRMIFERDLESVGEPNYSGLAEIGASDLQMSTQNRSLSILRYVANNTIQGVDSPVSFVMDYVRRMLYFRSTTDGVTYIGFTKGTEYLEQYIMKNGLVDDFKRFLKDTAKLDMDLVAVRTNGMPDVFAERYSSGKMLPFTWVASSGTKDLELFYYWSRNFNNVSFLFIDEFDAHYHYDLAREILKILMRFKNMQVLLTSYNTYLVGNELMRPDCYLIIKNGAVRSFSDSTDREIREGHNIEKMLRNGEFDD